MDRITREMISAEDWQALRRCERTLHRWSEMQCNHDVDERDDGTVWVRYCLNNGYLTKPQQIPNRAAGALRRAGKIAASYGLAIYEQGDPRGCGLYLYNPAEIGDDRIDSCYSSRGLAVCAD